MLNILYITHYASLYGANLSLLDLIDNICLTDIKPYVCIPAQGAIEKELIDRGIEYSTINFRVWIYSRSEKKSYIKNGFFLNLYRRARMEINKYFAIYAIKRKINEWNIDIVHTNSSCTHIGYLAAKKTDKPHVWHIREFIEEDYNLAFFNKNYSLKLLNKSNRVIAISEAIIRKYEKNINNSKLLLVYNGINVNKYKYSQKNKSISDIIEIAIIGAINKSKGQLEAIKSVERIVKNTKYNIALNIVGDGNSQYLFELKKYVDKNKLEDNVIFCGYREDIPDILNKADILLMCSNMEAFGRVTVEAMLSKTLVIGADTGGTVELISDNETGLLYKKGDYIDLSEKIILALENRDYIKQIVENAYNIAIQRYDIKKTAKAIKDVYLEIFSISI